MNKEYMVISHSFTAINNLAQSAGGSGASFQCEFEAIPAATQFRAARVVPRPTIAGTQTALVVADFRNDSETDKGGNLGRVKVRFYWDRYAKESCWARVSTPWAGKGYGFQNMPRVGEEVLVQFLEGDPDRPVVIGRVHNAENMPPFKLPASRHLHGHEVAEHGRQRQQRRGQVERAALRRFRRRRADLPAGAVQLRQARSSTTTRPGSATSSHQYVKSKDAFAKFDADHHVDTTGDHNEKIKRQAVASTSRSDIHVKSGTMFVVDGGQGRCT